MANVPQVGELLDGYRFLGGDPGEESSWQPMGDAPEPGDILDGYVFRGGDPGRESSWEKIGPKKGLVERALDALKPSPQPEPETFPAARTAVGPGEIEDYEAAARAGTEYWTGGAEKAKPKTGSDYWTPPAKAEPQAPADSKASRTWVELGTDVGRKFVSGAVSLAGDVGWLARKGVVDPIGRAVEGENYVPNTEFEKATRGTAESISGDMSTKARGQAEDVQKLMETGGWDGFTSTVGYVLGNPSMLPGLIAESAAGTAAIGAVGAKVLKAVGTRTMLSKAGETAVAGWATGAAEGIQTLGSVGRQIEESLDKAGVKDPEVRAQAMRQAIPAALATMLAGRYGGGVEAKFFADVGKSASDLAVKGGVKAAAKTVLKDAARETLEELQQGAGEQFFQNLGEGSAGLADDLSKGVGANAALSAAAGFAQGGAASIRNEAGAALAPEPISPAARAAAGILGADIAPSPEAADAAAILALRDPSRAPVRAGPTMEEAAAAVMQATSVSDAIAAAGAALDAPVAATPQTGYGQLDLPVPPLVPERGYTGEATGAQSEAFLADEAARDLQRPAKGGEPGLAEIAMQAAPTQAGGVISGAPDLAAQQAAAVEKRSRGELLSQREVELAKEFDAKPAPKIAIAGRETLVSEASDSELANAANLTRSQATRQIIVEEQRRRQEAPAEPPRLALPDNRAASGQTLITFPDGSAMPAAEARARQLQAPDTQAGARKVSVPASLSPERLAAMTPQGLEAALKQAKTPEAKAAIAAEQQRRQPADIAMAEPVEAPKASVVPERPASQDLASVPWDDVDPDRLRSPKVTKGGRIIGAPPGKDTEAGRQQIIRDVVRSVEKPNAVAEKSVDWYEKSGQEVARLAGGDRALIEKTVRLLALYSQGNQVGGNVTATIKSLVQLARGETPSAGRYPNITKPIADGLLAADRVSVSVPGVNHKILNFYRNLIDPATGEDNYPNAVTLDRWMMRRLGYKFADSEDGRGQGAGAKSLSAAQYAYAMDLMQRATRSYNAKHGTNIKPRQLQAMLWTEAKNETREGDLEAGVRGKREELLGMRQLAEKGNLLAEEQVPQTQKRLDEARERRDSFVPQSENFADLFKRSTALLTWETVPSTSSGILPGIANATLEQKAEFTKAAHAVLLNEKGENELLQQVSLVPLHAENLSEGTFEGALNPNIITGLVMEGGIVNPDTKTANVLADALGLLYTQDAVPWHTPDPNATKADGRTLGVSVTWDSDIDGEALYRHVGASVPGAEYTRVGRREYRFLNFTSLPDAEFRDRMTTALSSFKTEAHGDVVDFHARTAYRTGGQNGEDYRQRLREAGRSDLLRWVDRRREALARVYEDFGRRYGWGGEGQLRLGGGQLEREGPDGDVRQEVAPLASQTFPVPQVSAETPVFSSREQQSDAVTAVGVRFGHEKRTSLNGRNYGKGVPGQESLRIQAERDPELRQRLLNRVYFYAQTADELPRSESIITGNNVSRVKLTNLYDLSKDPRGLYAQAKSETDNAQDAANRVERLIMEAGFDGYVNRNSIPSPALVLLDIPGSVPAEYLGYRYQANEKLKAAAPKTQYDEVHHETIRKAIADGIAKFGGKGTTFADGTKVNIVPTERDVPQGALQTWLSEQGDGSIEGFYDPGSKEIWIITKNLSTPERAVFVATAHEVLHAGLRKTIGAENIDPVLRQIHARNKTVREAAAIRMSRGMPLTEAVEEVLADMPDRSELKGWDKLIKVIKDFLAKLGIVRWTDEQVETLVAAARASVRGEGPVSVTEGGEIAASEKAPVFYSELARQVAAAKSEKMPAPQWKAWLQNQQGIKKDELQWSGVLDWLDTPAPFIGMKVAGKLSSIPVPKQAILDYLNANGVQVTETVLGEDGAGSIMEITDDLGLESGSRAWSVQGGGGEAVADIFYEPDGEYQNEYIVRDARSGSFIAAAGSLAAARELATAEVDHDGGAAPKFSSYTLPGGKNYREVLLTLPSKPWTGLIQPPEARNAEFRSQHFDTPNILAHMRVNDRTDADGKRILFIEEIQSDWAQQGKRQGFDTKERRARAPSFAAPVPPEAPFVTKTEAWVALAVKRAIRMAADGGYDGIAWTTGEQQSNRYSLAKQVKWLDVAKNKDGTFTVTGRSADNRVFSPPDSIPANKLDEWVGKDLADRILTESDGKDRFIKQYKDLDLKVGGEGMRAFYDKIVPGVVRDVLKKVGGGQVSAVPMGSGFAYRAIEMGQGKYAVVASKRGGGEEVLHTGLTRAVAEKTAANLAAMDSLAPNNQPGFYLTPEMKAKAQQGMPLFSKRKPKGLADMLSQMSSAKPQEGGVPEEFAGSSKWERSLKILEALSKDDDSFQFGRSDSRDMDTIRKEMGLTEIAKAEKTKDGWRIEMKGTRTKEVDWVDPDGTPTTKKVTEPMVAFVSTKTDKLREFQSDEEAVRQAWINTADLREGRGGKQVYQLLYTWAANNGITVVPDPYKVSPKAMEARVANMLSAAMRLGTTKYMWPAGVVDVNDGYGWETPRWVDKMESDWKIVNLPGDAADRHNMRLLIEASLAIAKGKLAGDKGYVTYVNRARPVIDPETGRVVNLDNIEYNFDSDQVVYADTNDPVPQSTLDAIAEGLLPVGEDVPFGGRVRPRAGGPYAYGSAGAGADIAQAAPAPRAGAAAAAKRAIVLRSALDLTPDHLERIAARYTSGEHFVAGTPAAGLLASRRPDWVESGSADLKSAAAKVDTYAPDKTFKQKLDELKTNWAERFVQGVFDAYAPLKRLGRKEYVLARMVKSADASLEATLLYGKPRIDSDGVIHGTLDGKGFIGHMQDLNGEHDRFLLWVAGHRANRLKGVDRENLFTDKEIAAMMKLDDGKMKDGSSRKQAFAKAQEAFNAYNKAVLDIAEKTGLIDGESRKTWEHEFYVPFFRVNEDMKIDGPSKVKGLVRQKAFERLKGGKENLGDLLDNTLRNWSHLLSASLANQAALASLKAATRAGIATDVPQSAAQNMVKSAGVGGATFAMDGGVQHWFIVDDAQVLDAISAVESASFKGLPMELMGKFKHYLTLGVTVSPTFRIRNLMRDSISAIAQSDLSYNVAGNVWRGFKATDRQSKEYAEALFNGALIRFGQLTDGKHAEHAKRLILSGVDDSTILDTPQKAKAALGAAWDWWQETGDRAENVNRMSRYMQGLARGESALEAAFASRDMMDFSLQGSWAATRFLTQIVPFMNARLQGMYKLGRSAKEDPARMGYVVGAVALASIALLLAYKDDDEWKKREDWDRDNFWWFRIGNIAYRIPKPFEIGAMGTLAERSVELAISDEMTGKRFAERLRSMLGDTFALNPTPQLFKPMFDIYANKDSFSGRMIENRGMENLTKPERAGPNTSLVAKALGKAGEVTQLSPVQIDHLIRSYFGWLGSHAAMAVDLMGQPFMDVEKPARRLEDIFVLGDFVKGLPNNRSRYVEDFYKQAKVVHEVMGDLKRAREIHDMEKVREIMEERRDDIALSRLYTGAERKISEVNKRIRIVQGSNLSGEVKRQRLDELESQRAKIAEQVERIRTARRAAKLSPALSE